MRASIKEDVTERSVTIEVSDVTHLDVTESWNRRERVIRPDRVVVTIVDGELDNVQVSGFLLLKSGEPGRHRDHRLYHLPAWREYRHTMDEAPEWVRTLTSEILAGVTSWSTEPAQPVSMSEHPSGALILDVD